MHFTHDIYNTHETVEVCAYDQEEDLFSKKL
jgi:hypothetical protein